MTFVDKEKVEAVRKLGEMRNVLNKMSGMLNQMTEAAESAGAPGLAFASQMLRESVATFQEELTKFVARKIAE